MFPLELGDPNSLISFLCWLLSQKFRNILGCLFLLILVSAYKRAIFNDGMNCWVSNFEQFFCKGYGRSFLVGTGAGSILNMVLQ